MTHDLSETDRAQWLEWAKRQTVVMPLYCSHGILAFDAKLRAVEDERDALVERLKAAVTGWECKGCRASFFRESSTAARATVLADALQHIASHRLLAHDVVPYASAALARAADAANARAADPSTEPWMAARRCIRAVREAACTDGDARDRIHAVIAAVTAYDQRNHDRVTPPAAPAPTATTEGELMRAHAYERREQVVQALAATALAMVNAIDRNVFPLGESAAFMLLRDNLFHYGRELHGRPAAPPPAGMIAPRATPPAAPAAVTEARVDAAYAAYLAADNGGDSRFTLDRDCLRAAIAAASAAPEA